MNDILFILIFILGISSPFLVIILFRCLEIKLKSKDRGKEDK